MGIATINNSALLFKAVKNFFKALFATFNNYVFEELALATLTLNLTAVGGSAHMFFKGL